MPTPKKGARLGGSPANQRKILSNLAAQLFQHGAVTTTDAKAKLLRPYVEKLITKARRGTLHDRRLVAAKVPNKDAVARLFNELAPQLANRNGGYTRIIKVENRRGDNAPMSQISLALEETATAEATRATRAAASKQAEEAAAEAEAAENAEEDAQQASEAAAEQEKAAGESEAAETTESEDAAK